MSQEKNKTLFENALKEGNKEEIREYLAPKLKRKYVDAFLSHFWRPIHFACWNGDIDIVNMLFESQCDIECEDYFNSRPIHVACCNGKIEIVKLLIKKDCIIECEDKIKCRPVHYATRYGYTDLIQLLIENKCNLECEDINGQRPIHYASENGHFEILVMLILQNCSIECEDLHKRKPLPLAKQNNHKDCVDLLEGLTNRCFYTENENGREKCNLVKCEDPAIREKLINLLLLLMVKKKRDEIIHYFMNETLNNTELSMLTSVVSVGTAYADNQMLKEYLLFHCIKTHNADGFHKFGTADVINGKHQLISMSFLEIAAQFGCCAFISGILKKSIYKEEQWKRARMVAVEKGYEDIAEDIKNRETIIALQIKKNFTILHVAICDNDPEMVEYLLENKIVDANINHEIFGTALAWAHMLCRFQCIRVLEKFNIDSNTQNQFSQTPLHEAITSGTHEHCRYLIKTCKDIDKNGFNNLTALHCAVIEGCAETCELLVDRGADSNRYVNLSSQYEGFSVESKKRKSFLPLTTEENALTLCLKFNKTIFPCLFSIENIQQCCDGVNNSLLHLAAICLQSEICQRLLENGVSVNEVNEKGNTCLLELLSNECVPSENIDELIKVVKVLINYKVDTNLKTSTGLNTFECASRFNNEKLLMALLTETSQELISENDFRQALEQNWFEYAKLLAKILPKNRSSEWISLEIFSNNGITDLNLLKSLYEVANTSVQQSVLEDILYRAASNDEEDLFSDLIDNEISITKLFENGENLLTSLIVEKKINFCWKVIQSNNGKRYVNLKNACHQQPVEIATQINIDHKLIEYMIIHLDADVQQSQLEVILFNSAQENSGELFSFLITREIEIPKRLQNGETLLTHLLSEKKMEYCWGLIQSDNKEKYINFTNVHNQLPLEVAIKENSDYELIKFMIVNANADVSQLNLEEILFAAVENDDEDTFSFLLDKEVRNPKIFINGENLFTHLLLKNKANFYWKLISSNNGHHYINLKNEFNKFPLQIAVEMRDYELIQHMVIDANATVQQSDLEDILYMAANNNDEDLFEILIGREIISPKIFESGENLLTYLILGRKRKLSGKLFESNNMKKYIKFPNAGGQLPLLIALELDEMDIVDKLINTKKEINNNNTYLPMTLLQVLKAISNCNIHDEQKYITVIQSIINKDIDIYAKLGEKRLIDYCTKKDVKDCIEQLFARRQAAREKQNCNHCATMGSNRRQKCGHILCLSCFKRQKCPICRNRMQKLSKSF